MKTHGFSAFQKEFSATGREKIDGYTFANFDGMTPAEKSQAADMLVKELPSFFGAADALAYLDSARCEREIRKALQSKNSIERNRAFHLYFVLWQITGEEAAVDQILAAGRSGDADLTALLSDVAKIPTSAKILLFLQDLVLQHPNNRGVEQAASQLIDRYDVLSDAEICNADSIQLMRDLTSQLPTDKQAGLLKLQTEFKVRVA